MCVVLLIVGQVQTIEMTGKIVGGPVGRCCRGPCEYGVVRIILKLLIHGFRLSMGSGGEGWQVRL